MISDKEVEEIKAGSRDILNGFARALEGVKSEGEKIKKLQEGYRIEGFGAKADSSFREKMFANAPEKKGDCIIAEKKKWQ